MELSYRLCSLAVEFFFFLIFLYFLYQESVVDMKQMDFYDVIKVSIKSEVFCC